MASDFKFTQYILEQTLDAHSEKFVPVVAENGKFRRIACISRTANDAAGSRRGLRFGFDQIISFLFARSSSRASYSAVRKKRTCSLFLK